MTEHIPESEYWFLFFNDNLDSKSVCMTFYAKLVQGALTHHLLTAADYMKANCILGSWLAIFNKVTVDDLAMTSLWPMVVVIGGDERKSKKTVLIRWALLPCPQ